MNKLTATLFLLMSVDGKINSGSSDLLDVDRDWSQIDGVRDGLEQYYAIEEKITEWSLNTGRVMAKIGINERPMPAKRIPCNFVIIDNQPHLKASGIDYLCCWLNKLIIVTTNPEHPAYQSSHPNLKIIKQTSLNLPALFDYLANIEFVTALTIQSGGMLNGRLLREKLIDKIDIVVAPLLVGGQAAPTLIDGETLTLPTQLNQLGILKLTACQVLKDSYLRLQYDVIR
ncbi:MAG: dihydrofolate reductase family protein [Erysipelotrichaceae bacterium]|nr:dihydrofolate reductase family protein [Erysipelotrichaceae bacterium]